MAGNPKADVALASSARTNTTATGILDFFIPEPPVSHKLVRTTDTIAAGLLFLDLQGFTNTYQSLHYSYNLFAIR